MANIVSDFLHAVLVIHRTRIPSLPWVPSTIVHWTVGIGPHGPLPAHWESVDQRLLSQVGLDRLQGSIAVMAEGAAQTPRHLTTEETYELLRAFKLTGLGDKPRTFGVKGNRTADHAEWVHFGGAFNGRPFTLSYTGPIPYWLSGEGSEPWNAFLRALTEAAGI